MTERKQLLKDLRDNVAAGVEPDWNDVDNVARGQWANVVMAYHGSLDAAMAMHNAVLPDIGWEVSRVSKYPGMIPGSSQFAFRAEVGWGETFVGRADIPARSWLLCILDALIAQEPVA